MAPGFVPSRMLMLFSVCSIACFRRDDLGLGLLHQRLRLIDVGDGALATLELDGVQLQDFLVGLDRLLRVIELVVDTGAAGNSRSPPIEINVVCTTLLAVLCGQQDGARRLGGAAILSPEVDDVVQLTVASVSKVGDVR